MDPVTIGILGGTGLLSGILGNAAQERQMKAQMLARAAEQEAAPWTGMQAQTQGNFQGGNAGNLLAGAVSGVGQAQAFEQAGQQKDLNNAWIQMLKGKTQPTLMGGGDQMASAPWGVGKDMNLNLGG
jgi:hypothetical protein